MTPEQQLKRQDKITDGLKIAYARMLEFKQQQKSELIVVRDGKVVRIKP